jgi:hypothetical protein
MLDGSAHLKDHNNSLKYTMVMMVMMMMTMSATGVPGSGKGHPCDCE